MRIRLLATVEVCFRSAVQGRDRGGGTLRAMLIRCMVCLQGAEAGATLLGASPQCIRRAVYGRGGEGLPLPAALVR